MLWEVIFGIFLILDASSAHDEQRCLDKLIWSTWNNQGIVNGQPLVLKGINYHGFESDMFAPYGLGENDLNDILDFIKNNNFNAIRVPFSMELVRDNPMTRGINCDKNPGLCNVSAMRMLDIFINRASKRGLLVALSNKQHSTNKPAPLWYDSQYSPEQVFKLWRALIIRYKEKWNVFAIDLKSQPHGKATWGNSDIRTDWNKAAEKMINRLASFNGLFLVNNLDWRSQLKMVKKFPIDTYNNIVNNRVVYSPYSTGHSFFFSKDFNVSGESTVELTEILDETVMDTYAFLSHSALISNWKPEPTDGKWIRWYSEWLLDKCLTNNPLNINLNTTGGMFDNDWLNTVKNKIDLATYVQPNPTMFKELNGRICITHGLFPKDHCQLEVETNIVPSTPVHVTSHTTQIPTIQSHTTHTQISQPPTTQSPTTHPPTTQSPATHPPTTQLPSTQTTILRRLPPWFEQPKKDPPPSTSTYDGVTATLEKLSKFPGAGYKQYKLIIYNGSSSPVCSVVVRLNGRLDEWHMIEIAENTYRVEQFQPLAPGGILDRAGFLTHSSRPIVPTVVEVKRGSCKY